LRKKEVHEEKVINDMENVTGKKVGHKKAHDIGE
jgi:hypothetical protein